MAGRDDPGGEPVGMNRRLRRQDESADALFYRSPRFVTHIDDRAIAAVTQVYHEALPPGGSILDLMSSAGSATCRPRSSSPASSAWG